MQRNINLLIDDLPDGVQVDGERYCIATDHRTGLLFEQMLVDPDLTDDEKVQCALELYYGDSVPRNIEDALEALLWFYRCGAPKPPQPRRSPRNQGGSGRPEKILDYAYDAPYIYAAFLAQYGVDLNAQNNLHWWKFSAMLDGLKEDQVICKIMSYRALNLRDIKDKDERARYRRLKARYALPNTAAIAKKKAIAETLFMQHEEGANEDS